MASGSVRRGIDRRGWHQIPALLCPMARLALALAHLPRAIRFRSSGVNLSLLPSGKRVIGALAVLKPARAIHFASAAVRPERISTSSGSRHLAQPAPNVCLSCLQRRSCHYL